MIHIKKRSKTKTQDATQAIETIGLIDARHHPVPDETLPVIGPTHVRVSHLLPEEFDIYDACWLRVAAVNRAFDFLDLL